MKTLIGVFLINLKSFLIKLFSISFFLLLFACVQQAQIPIRKPLPHSAPKTNSQKYQNKISHKKAPWDVWEFIDYGDENLKLGNRLLEEGQLDKSIEKYQESLSLLKNSEQAEYALMMICSTLLKKDKPNDCLNLITKYASKRSIGAAQLDSRFSLLAGYSYLRIKDVNQTLAWFSQAFKASSGNGRVAQQSRDASRQLVRQQSQDSLFNLTSKWSNDVFVYSLIKEEKERRLRGAIPLKNENIDEYFDPTLYSLPRTPDNIPNADVNNEQANAETLSSAHSDEKIAINDIKTLKAGAILPLSGTYYQHSARVLKGIQLALEQNGVSNELIRVDSSVTNAGLAYQELVNKDKVNFVFGPLLVKDAEDVASISATLKKPAITFAKKRGLPESSVGLFRLGVTAENQLSEIMRISGHQVKLALLIPDDELGAEFKDAALSIQGRMQSEIFTILPYSNSSFESVSKAISALENSKVDGIVLIDSAKNLEPVIREIKSNVKLLNINLYGSAITSDHRHLTSYLPLLDGMRLVSFFNPSSKQFIVTKFIDDYKNRFNEMPDLLSAQGYDACQFIINAYKFNKGNEIEMLMGLAQLEGVTGTIINNASRDLYRQTRVIHIKNNSIVEE